MSEASGTSVLSRIGWMWLAEHTDGLAWELLGPNQSEDERLDIDFAEVYRSRIAPSIDIPAPDTQVDVIVLHHLPVDAGDSELRELLRTCRNHLKPGGYVVFSVSNRTFGRSIFRRVAAHFRSGASDDTTTRPAGESDLRTVARCLERAGFGSARCYLSAGSTARPAALVPAIRDAIVAHQKVAAPGPLPSWLRGLLAALGMGELLYPRIIAFGYR